MSSGRIIGGRYRLAERLGRGNFGVVWRADELLGGEPVATVAVKVFTTEVDRREISLLADLSHPAVLVYRSVVEDDGDVCLVTELADGGDAAARLRDWPDGMPAAEVREIVRSVGSALVHLHDKGWVHRDVKPANILFVQGRAKLGDVGTARALTSTARSTSTASLAYAAPEVFTGKFGPAVDVYALACTVYEFLTGRLPFDGSMPELIHHHMTSKIGFPADMPASFVAMIQACTTKDPEKRWTVERVLQWVDEENGGASETAPSPENPPTASMSSSVPSAGVEATAPLESTPSSAGPTPASSNAEPPPVAPVNEGGFTRAPRSTPLDPALRRHLRLHAESWGESDAWRSFMQVAESTAREHGLSERDLIRRAGQLLPEVAAAQLSEQETIAQVGAWVAALRDGRWSAPDWADFLDRINARDEAALASLRDSLIARLYPAAVGATRLLDLGGGVQHLLVYAPLDKLYRPATKVLDALRAQQATLLGVWFSARPITVTELSAITAQQLPPGLKPDAEAMAPNQLAESTLASLRRRFPVDELRWPTVFEYDGVKWQRGRAAQQSAAATLKANRAPALHRQQRGPKRRPATLGGLVARTVGKAAVNMVKERNEAWLSDAGSGATKTNKKRAMNLVSPVPRTT